MKTAGPKGRMSNKSFHIVHRLSNLILFLILPFACSVLEDRDECPCRLRIDLSAIPFPEVTLSLTDGSWQEVRTETLPREDALVMNVPKGRVDVLAVCPGTSGVLSREGWTIPPGEDCPPVYLGTVRVDTDREVASCAVTVHKNFCRLTLRLASDSGGDPFPFRLSVSGNVSGFSPEGVPLEGWFAYTLPPFDAAGATTVRLPRQKDASLELDILFSDDVLRRFALGNLMDRCGYDWTAPDLADLELTLDYARTLLTFRCGAWEESVRIEKVL